MTGAVGRRASPDPLALLAELVALARRMPPLTVPAEFATVGPVLYLMIGGRSGAQAYRDALHLDNEAFIPAYRSILATLLDGVPGHGWLDALVEGAVVHDHAENANLLAALDELDPPDGSPPRVRAATRYTLPAARHASIKFALLAPVLPPAAVMLAVCALRRIRTSPPPSHPTPARSWS